MANRLKIIVLFAFMALGIFAQNAFATNSHQDHQGACARSTDSISKGVGDLKYNGVLQEHANAVGIHGYNGSLTKQMEEKLVVGTAVHATAMSNNGCDGAGGTFGAGTRVIEKGEHVVVRIPPKYGKEVCRHPSSNCKKIRIVVNTAFPVSCWNKNTGRLEVWIWIRKPHHVRPPHHPHHKHPHHKHKHHKPKPPSTGSCNGNNTNNGNGSAGNCNVNVCVGNNVCNENTAPCNCHQPPCNCSEPPCNCKPPLVCPAGSVPNEKGTECVKDGSTTPPPPPSAPGPNPPPSGGTGDPGSNQCYDEITGQPVPARDGLCPPGSYGA
jgi:hypothetical protein